MARPVGQRPMEERSDWTEQDLLTIDEAAGRLDQELDDARATLAGVTDPDERDAIERRIRAMETARERYSGK